MIAPVDPFSSFKTNFNNTNTAATNAINNTASEIQQQTAPVTKSFDKKNAAIIGGVAALAIAGIGAAVMIKKGKMPDEVKEAFIAANKLNDEATSLAQSAQKQADEILETAQKKFDEVTELFKKGEETAADGTVLRKITKESDTQSVMEEFADGKLVRQTFFEEDKAQNIYENIEQLADGSKKAAKVLDFDNGKISYYAEDYENTDGFITSAKDLYFDNGKPRRLVIDDGYGDASREYKKEGLGWKKTDYDDYDDFDDFNDDWFDDENPAG